MGTCLLLLDLTREDKTDGNLLAFARLDKSGHVFLRGHSRTPLGRFWLPGGHGVHPSHCSWKFWLPGGHAFCVTPSHSTWEVFASRWLHVLRDPLALLLGGLWARGRRFVRLPLAVHCVSWTQ